MELSGFGGEYENNTHCSKRKEWFQGPSSEPDDVILYTLVSQHTQYAHIGSYRT